MRTLPPNYAVFDDKSSPSLHCAVMDPRAFGLDCLLPSKIHSGQPTNEYSTYLSIRGYPSCWRPLTTLAAEFLLVFGSYVRYNMSIL